MANEQNLKKGNKFSKDNQPERRGRAKQNRTLLLEALRKVRVKEATGRKIEDIDPDTGEVKLNKETGEPLMVDEFVEVQLTEDMFIQRAIQMALVDGSMMRDIMSRLIPYTKPTSPTYSFDLVGTSPSERITEIEDLVAAGELPFDAAEAMVKMIRHGAEVYEMSEMVKRLDALEARMNGNDDEKE